MTSAFLRRGPSIAAIAAAAILASCETGPSEAELEAARLAAEAERLARLPPPVELNDSVAQSASVYVSFMRDVSTIQGGFTDAQAIQEALRKGAAYDPEQLSRGMIAYASILALQSPEFVQGVREYAGDPTFRRQVIENIVANPAYAAELPGAPAAAGLIMATLTTDITRLILAADSVENDAYTIQERTDPRRAWAVAHIADRESRLMSTKNISGQTMLPSAEETARLFAAAHSGDGLGYSGAPKGGPYTPAINNALSIAALAALGAAGEEARDNTDALQNERTSQFCLNMSKLNLYQCLAASRPSYEDMFCVGRHVVRDLASCTRGAAIPAAVVTVSNPVTTGPAAPAITTAPLNPPPETAAPVISTQPLNSASSRATFVAPASPTATLNSSTATPYQQSTPAAPAQSTPVSPTAALNTGTATPYTPSGPN